MELVIYTPKEDQFVKAIEFNFEELRQEMSVRLERYNGLVYSEETIKEAKADRASLNKLKEAIESKRKEIKKQCLAPYEEFEKKIKQLTALIDEPILAIDSQVKSFEQMQKDAKREEITAYYNDNIGDLVSLLPLDKIFSDKWLNATTKLDAVYKEINERIIHTREDLQTIADLKSEFELQAKDTYLRTLDLSAALNEKTRLEQQKARMEEYEAQQAAKKAEAAKTVPIIEFEEPETVKPVYDAVYEAEKTKTIKVIFYDTTGAFRQEMKELTEKHNIRYGGIS